MNEQEIRNAHPANPLNLGSAPMMGAVQMPNHTANVYSGSFDESVLTPEEIAIVNKYEQELNLTDSKQVFSFGAPAQANVSTFSRNILGKVKTNELDDSVGDALKNLMGELSSTTEKQKKGIGGLFQKAKRSIDVIRADYAKVEANVLRIEKDLQHHQVILMQDISIFDQMYELTIQFYRDLTLYIIAGRKVLDRARNVTLVELKTKAEQTNLQEDVAAFNTFQSIVGRFEKRLHDLEITRTIATQTAPQVRMLQTQAEVMLEKIQSSIINAIPLWRNQMVVTLGIEHSKRAIDAQNAVTNTVNEMLMTNAENLRTATVETAKASERAIVDIETMRKVNHELVSSIREVVQIQEQGAKQRASAEVELVKLENELKQALLEAGGR